MLSIKEIELKYTVKGTLDFQENMISFIYIA